MSRKVKYHSPDIKYIRELQGRTAALKSTGLPSPLIKGIYSGKVKRLSHETYKKFRNAFEREVYSVLRSYNVAPSVARKTRRKTLGLTLPELEKAAEMTDEGITFESATNSMRTWSRELDRGEIDYDEIEDEIEDIADDLDSIADILVVNNGLFEQWKTEGRKFIYRDKRVVTRKDAIDHMKEIMALGFRDRNAWEHYVVERSSKENWQPAQFVKDPKSRKTVRELVTEGNPKYEQWTERIRKGKIKKVPAKFLKEKRNARKRRSRRTAV